MSTPQRHHRAPALARRDALLDAAIIEIAERGVGGATHRSIAARAGVPLSNTSYFFSSLHELLVEALRRSVAQQLAQADEVVLAIQESPASAAELVALFCDVLIAEPRVNTLTQFELYLEASRRPELHSEVEGVIDALERYFAILLKAANARDPEACARTVVALADGFALQRLASPRPDRDAHALREALLDTVAVHMSSQDDYLRLRAQLSANPYPGQGA